MDNVTVGWQIIEQVFYAVLIVAGLPYLLWRHVWPLAAPWLVDRIDELDAWLDERRAKQAEAADKALQARLLSRDIVKSTESAPVQTAQAAKTDQPDSAAERLVLPSAVVVAMTALMAEHKHVSAELAAERDRELLIRLLVAIDGHCPGLWPTSRIRNIVRGDNGKIGELITAAKAGPRLERSPLVLATPRLVPFRDRFGEQKLPLIETGVDHA